MRIAAFGFRTLPPAKGAAGADKFALELFPRLVKLGHSVVAYNRQYKDVFVDVTEFKGVTIKTLKTVSKSGFDTLLHSCKATFDIIVNNTADIVHIQNGGNSIWALPLRLFGKKVFISQDGVDWKRDKWPWYGKLYLKLSAYLTATLPNQVIFDNVIAKRLFEDRFKKQFTFIPFGSEVDTTSISDNVLRRLSLTKGGYYLFIGRFIPDKGLHYLIPGFKQSNSNKKLVLIGGSPNSSEYEKEILAMGNEQIIFPGYIYGDEANSLIANAYCYIQPSDVEGLSPIVLTVMGLNVPMIVSDIPENLYVVEDTVTTFKKADAVSLAEQIDFCEANYDEMEKLARKAQQRALSVFNWDRVAEEHVQVFSKY
ncbi:glycosyltransferase [Mucilaginibacter ginkgonis]|uniref:Glycosyltransferase n=1 Tax=Mucilaginibacter ginkgonis TaxID=2682091 RepID=A0A6I4I1V5_9SPHI|nr:glycosyltransferase [Mucilaginibacter ginkgonis]QQL50872.1 glycosyltransferase [Mucilaginibacter ginkgonis]